MVLNTNKAVGAAESTATSTSSVPLTPFRATRAPLSTGEGTARRDLLLAVPSPVDKGARVALKGVSGTDEVEVAVDSAAPTALFVFKTIYDQFSGRVNLARIFSGKIATDSQLLNARTNERERTGNILLMQGKETKT